MRRLTAVLAAPALALALAFTWPASLPEIAALVCAVAAGALLVTAVLWNA
jgi:hypothetical protein